MHNILQLSKTKFSRLTLTNTPPQGVEYIQHSQLVKRVVKYFPRNFFR